MNFTQAKSYCESLGTQMVEIDSASEQALVVDTVLAGEIGIQSAYSAWLGMDTDGK